MWVKLGPRSLAEEEALLRNIDTYFLEAGVSEEKVGEDTEQFLPKKKRKKTNGTHLLKESMNSSF